MIFQHTIDAVLSGKKTQTRRLFKADKHSPSYSDGRYHAVYGVMGNPPIWEVGHTYAAQPGRGKKAVARIRVTHICREDVRMISYPDAIAEGFDSRIAFLETWASMHDKALGFYCAEKGASFYSGQYRWWGGRKDGWQDADLDSMLFILDTRPAERYAAWALTFEVIE